MNPANDNVMTSESTAASPSSPKAATGAGAGGGPSGVAGRINYAQWDKVASKLVDETDKEEEEEIAREKAKLGLDGKYARSEAEAKEREKLNAVKETKKTLDKYKKREMAIMQNMSGLLGPVADSKDGSSDNNRQVKKSTEAKTVRITQNDVKAGNRVLTVLDTSGKSVDDSSIVLTQDLSNLESKMKANAVAPPKSYPDDAENDVVVPKQQQQSGERSVFGLIKLFVTNVHNCTIYIKCKIISGFVEIHGCTNVVVRIESTATVATVQADLCENLTVEFRDAPSGKNVAVPVGGLPGGGLTPNHKMYWGDDSDDRIYHAGVKNMTLRIVRDGLVETETTADYLKDGAVAVGNATAEEVQFVTSVVKDNGLVTERVMRGAGSSTGSNARAMTQRELDEEKARREKAAEMAIKMAEDMIQIKDKDGNVLAAKKKTNDDTEAKNSEEEKIEEVYASMSGDEIKLIVNECEQNKAKGNEAFGAGEYGQAILMYSLALDKASELPDATENGADSNSNSLFPRDVLLSNRAACFLKLGQHEKAEEDARKALEMNPTNVKAVFRRGLSLHAMGRYRDAMPILAEAHKIEPKNKQIKQALQFCEVRLAQEERKRMQS